MAVADGESPAVAWFTHPDAHAAPTLAGGRPMAGQPSTLHGKESSVSLTGSEGDACPVTPTRGPTTGG
jgi:hypothetical protein